MLAMTLGKIAKVVGGSVAGDPDVLVDAPAYVDSREAVPGGLFVAVVGKNVDGHDYAAGAHAVLGSRPTEAPTVVVRDPIVALGKLAGYVVRRLDATVLAVTGSQGKTGTKDYLAQVLAAAGSTVATAGSSNNELGLPLTVLRAHAETRFLVLEMGARRIGHIAYLCEIAPPHVAAVLNVGTAHIGEFGSRESIAFAKGEIIAALPADGTAVLNGGDSLVAAMASRTDARVLTFGPSDADVTERVGDVDDLGRVSFEIGYADEWHSAATASSPMRMEVHERDDGLVVVNDAYNANPASTTAALEALAIIGRRRDRRTVAVLGEMFELGRQSYDGHVKVGRAAARLGTDVVVVVGAGAGGIVDGLQAVDAWTGEEVVTEGPDEAIEWVRENVASGDVVLVKASHGVALWVVVDALLDPEAEGDRSEP